MISISENEVRYSETDQMGVVYHANYLVWLELGRTKFLKDLGFDYSELEKRNLIFPVREININYLKPCRYGETIIVETSVKEFSSIKTVYQHTVKNTNNEIKAQATSCVICVNKEDFRITKLEKQAKDIYDAYMNIVNKDSR